LIAPIPAAGVLRAESPGKEFPEIESSGKKVEKELALNRE
jgi:hypothetical protein